MNWLTHLIRQKNWRWRRTSSHHSPAWWWSAWWRPCGTGRPKPGRDSHASCRWLRTTRTPWTSSLTRYAAAACWTSQWWFGSWGWGWFSLSWSWFILSFVTEDFHHFSLWPLFVSTFLIYWLDFMEVVGELVHSQLYDWRFLSFFFVVIVCICISHLPVGLHGGDGGGGGGEERGVFLSFVTEDFHHVFFVVIV